MKEFVAGPTRGEKSIDKILVNYTTSKAKVKAPLQPIVGTREANSDHRIVYASAIVPRKKNQRWETFKVRGYIEKKAEAFRGWIVGFD